MGGPCPSSSLIDSQDSIAVFGQFKLFPPVHSRVWVNFDIYAQSAFLPKDIVTFSGNIEMDKMRKGSLVHDDLISFTRSSFYLIFITTSLCHYLHRSHYCWRQWDGYDEDRQCLAYLQIPSHRHTSLQMMCNGLIPTHNHTPWYQTIPSIPYQYHIYHHHHTCRWSHNSICSNMCTPIYIVLHYMHPRTDSYWQWSGWIWEG